MGHVSRRVEIQFLTIITATVGTAIIRNVTSQSRTPPYCPATTSPVMMATRTAPTIDSNSQSLLLFGRAGSWLSGDFVGVTPYFEPDDLSCTLHDFFTTIPDVGKESRPRTISLRAIVVVW